MSNNDTKALFPFKTDKFWEEDDGKHNGWDVLSEFFNSNKGKEGQDGVFSKEAKKIL